MNRHTLLNVAATTAIGLTTLAGSAVGQEAGEHKLFRATGHHLGTSATIPPTGCAGGGAVRRSGQGRPVCSSAEGAEGLPHSTAHPSQARDRHRALGNSAAGDGNGGRSRKAQVLPAGGFFAMPARSVHSFFADDDTVIQLNSSGPWGINYINPKDDPRPKM